MHCLTSGCNPSHVTAYQVSKGNVNDKLWKRLIEIFATSSRTPSAIRQNTIYVLIYVFYEGESISNQPNLFPVEIHLFFFDVIAL